MDLIILVLIACLIGFLVYILTTKIPMPDRWATAIQIFALVMIIFFLLSRIHPLPNILGR